MASVPLDTLRVSRTLRDAGFSEPQAEALTWVVSETREQGAREAVTHAQLQNDFTLLRVDLERKIDLATNPIRADVLVLKWMMGFVLAGMLTMITLMLRLLNP